ncbi:MAG: host-nuclease inhibitor Gam family protein [Candidatus Brocadiia bacterium]
MTVRKAQAALRNWSEVDGALARLCRLEHDRQQAFAEMNAELAAVKLRFNAPLEDMAGEDALLREALEQFAREHREQFSPRKTIERLHGVLSFRTTPPAVKVLRRPWTEDERIERVRAALGADCIRVREEIARDAILTRAASGLIRPDQLAEAGLRIGRREVFELELKGETIADFQLPIAK